jgi:hypothetical protein
MVSFGVIFSYGILGDRCEAGDGDVPDIPQIHGGLQTIANLTYNVLKYAVWRNVTKVYIMGL